MSRTKAKKQMSGQELKRELEGQGIIVSAGQAKLLAEEAPYAYKDVSEVVETCEGAGLTKVVARLRPVGVVKVELQTLRDESIRPPSNGP